VVAQPAENRAAVRVQPIKHFVLSTVDTVKSPFKWRKSRSSARLAVSASWLRAREMDNRSVGAQRRNSPVYSSVILLQS
jgi:hypothetical protein